MKLVIYRGTREVGGTVIELKTRETRILLDAGYPLFLHGELIHDSLQKKPYHELMEAGVIPQIKGLYYWDRPEFDGVVISHAHSDHYGLLRYLHPDIPIYCTETTKKLIEMSLSFPVKDFKRRRWCVNDTLAENLASGRKEYSFFIGDILFREYPMDHSAFGAVAYEIKGDGKTILYTGDFRGHGRHGEKLDRFIESAPKGADLLLIEGTTLGKTTEKEMTEEGLKREAEAIIRDSSAVVLVRTSSQNIERILGFYEAARACGRIFVIDSYTACLFHELNRLGHRLPEPSIWEPGLRVHYTASSVRDMRKVYGRRCVRRFWMNTVCRFQIRKEQRSMVMLIRPSMLFDLKQLNLNQGEFIYSMWQAYRSKWAQQQLEHYLKSRGFSNRTLHTGGHALKQDIRRVIDGLMPKRIIPIHTFHPDEFLSFSDKAEPWLDGKPIDV